MKNTKTVTFWLDKNLVAKARRRAIALGISFDQYVDCLLRKWLESKLGSVDIKATNSFK